MQSFQDVLVQIVGGDNVSNDTVNTKYNPDSRLMGVRDALRAGRALSFIKLA